jgi:hypothetical protein
VRHVDQNPNVVTLSGFGNGGVEELKDSLEDNSVMYGLGRICNGSFLFHRTFSITHNSHLLTFTARFEEQIDQSSTVKFVYIHWIGKQVPFTMKGRYGIVHGSARKYFEVMYCSIT